MEERLVNAQMWIGEMQKILEEGKTVPFVITGSSMSPFLAHKRDSVLVKKPDRDFEKGDIVFYQRENGQFVLHRIVKIDRVGNLFMAGDAQTVIEGPAARKSIFGVVVQAKRKGTWIQKGDFWWDFFAGMWIKILPFRRIVLYGYTKVRRRREER